MYIMYLPINKVKLWVGVNYGSTPFSLIGTQQCVFF